MHGESGVVAQLTKELAVAAAEAIHLSSGGQEHTEGLACRSQRHRDERTQFCRCKSSRER
jgi:hypothetical protein